MIHQYSSDLYMLLKNVVAYWNYNFKKSKGRSCNILLPTLFFIELSYYGSTDVQYSTT